MKKSIIVAAFTILLLLTPLALATNELQLNGSDIENLDLDKIDASKLDIDELDINELNLPINITLREVLELVINKTEPMDLEHPPLKYILPCAVKVLPSDTSEPFILQLSKEGMTVLDEAEYQRRLDFEAGLLILLQDRTIRVDYIKPNSFVACVLASIFSKQYDVRIENTDTTKYKIANFVINIACKLSGQCETSKKVPFDIKLSD